MRWSNLRRIGQSPLVRAAAIVPFIGYMILFNHYIHTYIDPLEGLFQTQPDPTFADRILDNKLNLIFVGLFFIGLASTLYVWFCPAFIKKYPDAPAYIKDQEAIMTKPILSNMQAYLDYCSAEPMPDDLTEGDKTREVMFRYYVAHDVGGGPGLPLASDANRPRVGHWNVPRRTRAGAGDRRLRWWGRRLALVLCAWFYRIGFVVLFVPSFVFLLRVFSTIARTTF